MLIFRILRNIRDALDFLVPIFVTLALIYFIWGIIQYVIAASEEKKTDAKTQILYGIIGMFIIVTIWGIINFVGDFLGTERYNYPPILPYFNPIIRP